MHKKERALNWYIQGPHKKGGDLLSHFRSTIGAEGLNFSVRNGKRWNTLAKTTLALFRIYSQIKPSVSRFSFFYDSGRNSNT